MHHAHTSRAPDTSHPPLHGFYGVEGYCTVAAAARPHTSVRAAMWLLFGALASAGKGPVVQRHHASSDDGKAVDCTKLVPNPIDAMPTRSPQVLHSLLATHFRNKDIVEIGTRTGDGMACFSQVARRAIAIEMDEGYCRHLENRSHGTFEVICKRAEDTVFDADIITWWVGYPYLNDLLLKHLGCLIQAGQLRRNAQAYILFDHSWDPDMKSLSQLGGLAVWSNNMFADEHGLCLQKHPPSHKYHKLCPGRSRTNFTTLAIPLGAHLCNH